MAVDLRVTEENTQSRELETNTHCLVGQGMRKRNEGVGTRIRTMGSDKGTIIYTLHLRGAGLTFLPAKSSKRLPVPIGLKCTSYLGQTTACTNWGIGIEKGKLCLH